MITQSKKFQGVKCWSCGHGHHLRDCPNTTDAKKQEIYQQKRDEIAKNSKGPKNHSSYVAAAKSGSEDNNSTPSETSNTTSSNSTTNMARRKGTVFAAPAKHYARVASVLDMTRTNPQAKAHTAMSAITSREPHTLISDWLIDSGCTAHMTPHRNDFIGRLEEYSTLVETANGGLVEVTHRGKVKIQIHDAFRSNHSITVYLNNTLYVPNLSR
jgi:hypothetical protein